MKTLLFCTSYATSAAQWKTRYRKWLDFFTRCPLRRDQILFVDDGSPVLPDWRDIRVISDLLQTPPLGKCVMFHFPDNLGRTEVFVYPGWYRSFTFAAQYAQKYGFTKIVHVESDSYLYSPRIVEFINELNSGWTTFWCPRWNFPETCIQVICEDQLDAYAKLAEISYAEKMANRAVETLLPFTDVRKDFVGDRYGEYLSWVPEDADYASQIPEEWPI